MRLQRRRLYVVWAEQDFVFPRGGRVGRLTADRDIDPVGVLVFQRDEQGRYRLVELEAEADRLFCRKVIPLIEPRTDQPLIDAGLTGEKVGNAGSDREKGDSAREADQKRLAAQEREPNVAVRRC